MLQACSRDVSCTSGTPFPNTFNPPEPHLASQVWGIQFANSPFRIFTFMRLQSCALRCSKKHMLVAFKKHQRASSELKQLIPSGSRCEFASKFQFERSPFWYVYLHMFTKWWSPLQQEAYSCSFQKKKRVPSELRKTYPHLEHFANLHQNAICNICCSRKHMLAPFRKT